MTSRSPKYRDAANEEMIELIEALALRGGGLGLFTGCGQSGPLYIPGNPTRIEQPPAAEQSADEEAEENGDSESDKNRQLP